MYKKKFTTHYLILLPNTTTATITSLYTTMPLSTLRTYGPMPPAAVYSSITTGFATI